MDEECGIARRLLLALLGLALTGCGVTFGPSLALDYRQPASRSAARMKDSTVAVGTFDLAPVAVPPYVCFWRRNISYRVLVGNAPTGFVPGPVQLRRPEGTWARTDPWQPPLTESFTGLLVRDFTRIACFSRVGLLPQMPEADFALTGFISEILVSPPARKVKVLAVKVKVSAQLVRVADQRIVWQGVLEGSGSRDLRHYVHLGTWLRNAGNALQAAVSEAFAKVAVDLRSCVISALLGPSQAAAGSGPSGSRVEQHVTTGGTTVIVGGKPSDGTVSIKSKPAGAKVYLDGAYVGRTPTTFPVAAGKQELEIRAEGYKTWKEPIMVFGGRETPVEAELEKAQE